MSRAGGGALALALALALSPGAARAQEEAGAHEEGAGAHEGAGEGGARISNWWSWDYGPSATLPSHRDLPPPFGFALVNFAVLLGLVTAAARKPMREFLRGRRLEIKEDLDAARRLRAEAEARLRDYEARVAGLEAEIGALVAGVRREAEEERARLIAEAQAESARLRREAERQVERELKQLRAELEREAAAGAVALAERLIAGAIDDRDQRRLAERFVTSLGAPGEGARP